VAVHAESIDIRTKGAEYFAPFDVVIVTEADFDTIASINTHTRLSNRPLYATASHGFYGYIFADLISHDYVIQRDKSNVPTVLKAETSTRSVVAATTKKENGKVVEIVTKREIYSPIAPVNSAPLPAEHLKNRRRLRQVTPLLSAIRALWEFQRLSSNAPPSHSHADLELFTTLATAKHKELQLPPETLSSEFLRSFLQNVGAELAPVTAFLGGVLAQDVINVLGGREQPIQNFLLFDAGESKAPVYALHPLMNVNDPVVA
jgi:ubiquitin-like 1-activating enzyme E1 A